MQRSHVLRRWVAQAALLPALAASCAAPDVADDAPARASGPFSAVPSTDVRLEGGLWGARLATNRAVTVPYTLALCESTGRIRNFAVAGGLEPGGFEGIFFNDSDVYKVVEGASYALASHPDPALAADLDTLVARIAAAQEDDGYLYTQRTIEGDAIRADGAGPARWSRLSSSHELYNVGHLYEAAVAHHAATGSRALLDVALRNAELVRAVFGPDAGQRRDVPGHEEIELALVKLADATGDARWLELARFFLDERGRHDQRASQGAYTQDHLPVAEQTEAVGHAVRAGYLYAAMADVAARVPGTGYERALDALWADVVGTKTYLTGGVGATRHGEAFGAAYELPNETAYAETCAAVAQMLWNRRMLLARGETRYADVLERALLNGFLSGVSLGGDRFFYPNPLACDGWTAFNQGERGRAPWFACSCCPVNVVRVVPEVPGWVYATRGDELLVDLYAGGEARVRVAGHAVVIAQATDYPWDGTVRLTLTPDAPTRFALRLRVPGWARGEPMPLGLYRDLRPASGAANLRVDGADVPLVLEDGYARVERTWSPGDVVELALPMDVRRVVADERVEADRGRVAFERGPLVFCFEGVDNDGAVGDLVITDDAAVTTRWEPDLLGGTLVLDVAARRVLPDGRLVDATATAVPYHLWAHRGPGPMAVWMARDAATARPEPAPPFARAARASASHCWVGDTLLALADGRTPRASSDQDLPRFTWWDRRGSLEWVRYDFDAPVEVASVEVYWFDDTGAGSCRVPESWSLYAADDEAPTGWRELVADRAPTKDAFDRATFAPVTTSALRLEAQLGSDVSAGILEWRVVPVSSSHGGG